MIRPAAARDCAAIAAIWNPLIRDTLVTFTTEEKTVASLQAALAEKAAAGYPFLLIEEDGAILGFATYGQFRQGPGYAQTMEHTVILVAEARGRGLGRALMATIEAHAKARGAHSMIAGVSGGNDVGRAFHLRMGYDETAILPEVGYKFGRWHSLILMQKLL